MAIPKKKAPAKRKKPATKNKRFQLPPDAAQNGDTILSAIGVRLTKSNEKAHGLVHSIQNGLDKIVFNRAGGKTGPNTAEKTDPTNHTNILNREASAYEDLCMELEEVLRRVNEIA